MAVAVLRRMTGRDPDEEHRPSTPLELLVDLSFVVAVAQVAAELHHALAEGHVGAALPGYLMVFFAIWWAWMNFTWFASAFDVDDLPYRLLTFVQIAGVLVLAAGVPSAFENLGFGAIVVGYVLMRFAMVTQWLRVARSVPSERAVALRYAAGITIVQVGWIAWLWVPDDAQRVAFVLLAICELVVPVWAEQAGPMTPWHPSHIAERYGLFTIIVIGESILAGTVTLQAAFTEGGLSWELVGVAVGGLAVVFAVWWCYFDREFDEFLQEAGNKAFLWGYAHYFVFASVAAIGAGLQTLADASEHHAQLTDVAAAYAVAVPAAVYFVVLGALHTGVDRDNRIPWRYFVCAIGMLAVAATATTFALPVTLLLVAAFPIGAIVVDVARQPR